MNYIIGKERPATHRTPTPPTAWIARTRLLSSAGQAGVLPCDDTASTADIDWTSSPTSPPRRTFAPSTANNHAATPAQPAAHPTVIDVPERIGRPHWLARWVPWSLMVAAPGVGLVWLAVEATSADSMVGRLAVISVLVCGLLLVLAQVLDQTGTRR